MHVGFSRAVERWVQLSAPPVESCFCAAFHWGGPRFSQAQREVLFESDLNPHPHPDPDPDPNPNPNPNPHPPSIVTSTTPS